ncbi:HAMP domain-containing sensor histidine kinase [Chryseomicrobium sp. FSL W7-1435]|uniref:HAMP domain-containing sensor histidine kinase n=1 Tax=Chryseomicrobium sp. FSL W7-1435 TaxID=2921704 RepID=UPI00315AF830
MEFLVADLLLNFLLILTPLYFFQFVISNYNSIGARVFLGLLLGFASILCMLFPMVSGEGFLWDLRWVALFISIVYGGMLSGGITATLIILFRFSLGGFQGALIVVGVALALILIFSFVRRGFLRMPFKRRILASGGLGVIAWGVAVAGIILHFSLNQDLVSLQQIALPVFSTMFILYIVSSVAFIYFSENMLYYSTLKNEALTTEKVNYITEVGELLGTQLTTHIEQAEFYVSELKEKATITDRATLNAIEGELEQLNLALSKYTSGQDSLLTADKKPLAVIAEEVAESLLPYTKQKGVRLTLDVEVPVELEFTYLPMKQVLVNLVKNALDATPKGGQVTLSALIKRNWLFVYVDDNGIGIAQDQLIRLMDLTYGSGNSIAGQGLRVTQQLVRELEGTFSITSEVQKGTTITLKFPI